MKSKKPKKVKEDDIKLFSIVKIKGIPYKGMYGFVMTKKEEDIEVCIESMGELVTANYVLGDLKKYN